MEKVDLLRKTYPFFVYRGYNYKISGNDLNVDFDFIIETKNSSDNLYFKPEIIIKNIDLLNFQKIPKEIINNLVFNLGLIELISYWKAACSPEIIIKAGALNKEQAKWWKDLIIKGMGQFFYENKINFTKADFLKIISEDSEKIRKNYLLKLNPKKIMAPAGGGKDSAVTLEILRKSKNNARCFSLNPTNSAIKITRIAGCQEPIIIKRKIDEKLLKLNREGFLNSHTPFSAYLAFLTVFCAVLFDYKYVVLSNERSSNEGNLKYLGKNINHQYSKSFDFEKKFRDYSKKYLARNVEYFSFLRPLYEIQIAKIFAAFPRYFSDFLSCNEAHKTFSGTKNPIKKWCGNCSKCLFVFISLYPWIGEEETLKIFGENLFEKKELLPIMQELTGEKKFKPFECVGAKKESIAAFYLALRSFQRRRVYDKLSVKLPFLLKYFQDKILPKHPRISKECRQIINSWNFQNNLPVKFDKMLKSVYNKFIQEP